MQTLSAQQPVVKVWLHSTGDASPPAALLLPQILPVFSVVAPCPRGASPVSVRRQTFTTGWLTESCPGGLRGFRSSGRGGPSHAAPRVRSLPSEDGADLEPERFRHERRGEVGVASGLVRGVTTFADCGHDHDRNVFGPARLTQVLEYCPAIDARHRKIEDDDVRAEIVGLVDAAPAVGRCEGDTSVDPEVLRVHPPRVHIIVDDEDRRRFGLETALCGAHVRRVLPIVTDQAPRSNIVASTYTSARRHDP